MKIIGINGSPRGEMSRTLRLVEAVLDGAKAEGSEVELIDICSLKIDYCTGCANCYKTGECTRMDDFGSLQEKIFDADGVVLGSPVYIDGVTAQLKTMIDRMADAIHCMRLFGKYGCAVSTAGGSGQDEVIGIMNRFLGRLGAVTVGGVGIALGRNPQGLSTAEEQAFELGRDLAKAIETRRRYPEQEKRIAEAREYFRTLITANREEWAHEYEYWVDKGWIVG
jgi:multimeric flavodoxin WrbA